MYLYDWDDFLEENSWLDGEASPPQMASDGLFQPSLEFLKTFPILSKLLKLARVTVVNINEQMNYLYGWSDEEGLSFGWQCLPVSPLADNVSLHTDHALLLSGFGGIIERWGEPDNWLLNCNAALCENETVIGFGGWEEYYFDQCNQTQMPPILNPTDYRTFVKEANGNCTIYHATTGQVLMLDHNDNFDYCRQLDGCPKRTLYTFNNCPDFRTWVETIAAQWLEHVAKAE